MNVQSLLLSGMSPTDHSLCVRKCVCQTLVEVLNSEASLSDVCVFLLLSPHVPGVGVFSACSPVRAPPRQKPTFSSTKFHT